MKNSINILNPLYLPKPSFCFSKMKKDIKYHIMSVKKKLKSSYTLLGSQFTRENKAIKGRLKNYIIFTCLVRKNVERK